MKSEVYSWRLSFSLKSALEETAHKERASLSLLLERIVTEWLKQRQSGRSPEDEEQQRLQAAAVQTFGSISGSNPGRSIQAHETIRTRLARHYAH